jgi:hypothetical protein
MITPAVRGHAFDDPDQLSGSPAVTAEKLVHKVDEYATKGNRKQV